MANYQHILLAADFSKENSIVVDRAIEMARQNDAKLSLIHVVEYIGTLYTGEIPLPDDLDLEEQLLEQAQERLQKLASDHQITESRRFVELGTPKQEIMRIAEEQQVDLIIIGSHGRHGLQLLLGSTANAVLHVAKCDVLAVRVQ
ncbi:MAG: universal stress protein [Gammaproteobacteria bacterium]|nr:universal stress protein [Gammaproteobacteria bacterium]